MNHKNGWKVCPGYSILHSRAACPVSINQSTQWDLTRWVFSSYVRLFFGFIFFIAIQHACLRVIHLTMKFLNQNLTNPLLTCHHSKSACRAASDSKIDFKTFFWAFENCRQLRVGQFNILSCMKRGKSMICHTGQENSILYEARDCTGKGNLPDHVYWPFHHRHLVALVQTFLFPSCLPWLVIEHFEIRTNIFRIDTYGQWPANL